MTSSAVTFAVLLPALLVAHNVADHWVQTSHQAGVKGQPGRPGRWACAAHVATYTAVTAAAVGLLWGAFDLSIHPAGFVVGQLLSAVTHYWADRRFTLARLCDRLGKGEFYNLGKPRDRTVTAGFVSIEGGMARTPIDIPTLGTGAYALDQSWHWAWLGAAAFVTAVL